MFCPKCGTSNPDGATFCGGCGESLSQPAQSQPIQQPAPQQYSQQQTYQQPAQTASNGPVYGEIMSAWAFLGYSILFCIPLVGIILLIVFAVSQDNICRRNFARSFLLAYAIGLVLVILITMMGGCAALTMYGTSGYY